jgi:hypothetical protein
MLIVTYAECHIQALYAECRYAECHCAECDGAIFMACKKLIKQKIAKTVLPSTFVILLDPPKLVQNNFSFVSVEKPALPGLVSVSDS